MANLTKIKNACKEKSTNVSKGLFVEKFTFYLSSEIPANSAVPA